MAQVSSFQTGQKLESPGNPYATTTCSVQISVSLLIQKPMELQMTFLIVLLYSMKLSILKTATRNEVTKIH